MAKGTTHDQVTMALASVMAGAALYTGAGWLIYSALGATAGLLLSPDLDLSNSAWKCKAWHRWNRLNLGWYWKPYGLLPHRSPLSHWPLVGTAGRVIYVVPIGFWLIYLLDPFGLLAAIAGLALADTFHWLLDRL